jgi:hypothetical protein
MGKAIFNLDNHSPRSHVAATLNGTTVAESIVWRHAHLDEQIQNEFDAPVDISAHLLWGENIDGVMSRYLWDALKLDFPSGAIFPFFMGC